MNALEDSTAYREAHPRALDPPTAAAILAAYQHDPAGPTPSVPATGAATAAERELTVYNWKGLQEIGWGAFVAALTFALSAFVASESLDKAFLTALILGSARAAAGFVLSKLSPAPPA